MVPRTRLPRWLPATVFALVGSVGQARADDARQDGSGDSSREPPTAEERPPREPPQPSFDTLSPAPLDVARAVAVTASLVPIPTGGDAGSSSNYGPVGVVGTVFGGLGASCLMGAGMAWIVAFTASTKLDEECPSGRCVRGSRGGREYLTARDGLAASGWLAGLGLPMMAGGFAMLAIDLAVGSPPSSTGTLAPHVALGPEGFSLEMDF